MKNLKKILNQFLVLIFPVMLGVYLGLLANDWSQRKTEKVQIEKALHNIQREIAFNQAVVAESMAYFSQLRDSVQLLKDRNIRPSSFAFWQGLNPPLLKSASYQSASISGLLAKLDVDLLEQITTAYNIQADLELQTSMYVQSVTNKIGEENFTNEKYLVILENYAHDQISVEESLIEELKNLTALINDHFKRL